MSKQFFEKQIGGKIVESLRRYKPEKIILFGSYAWGKPAASSDVDVLIIKKTKQHHFKRIPEARKYLFDIDRPFDVLVLTPREVQRRLDLGDFFIEKIINRGKILYEAASR